MTEARWSIVIDKDHISEAALVPGAGSDLSEGEIEVRLDLCAMTANNVTYAVLGRPTGLFGNGKGYWDFFSPGEGAGVLPVWGFASVIRSRCEGLAPGEQLYGFFPLASHCILRPARIGRVGFADVTPHRQDMAAVYNSYQRVTALDGYRALDHDWWPVFRPLYLTGWLIADQFEDYGDYDADQIVVTGASAKTAIAFAHAAKTRMQRPRLIGLTSSRGNAFLELTSLYDAVILYDDIADLAPVPTAVVDVAGNAAVVAALHERLGPQLRYHLVVGKTHWDAKAEGPWPANGFFAPGRIEKRMQDWGPEMFRNLTGAAWADFLRDAAELFTLDRRDGPEQALEAYRQAVAGEANPRFATVVSM